MSGKNSNQNPNEEVDQSFDESRNDNRGKNSEEDHSKKMAYCPYMNSCPMMLGAQMMPTQSMYMYPRDDELDSDGGDDSNSNFEGYRHNCRHQCYPCYPYYYPYNPYCCCCRWI